MHIPITINGNDELLKFVNTNGWKGDGSPTNPVVIGHTTPVNIYTYSITFVNITLHVIIENLVFNFLHFKNCKNIIIRNCVCVQCNQHFAILCTDCENIYIYRNCVYSKTIDVSYCHNCVLINNIMVSDETADGMRVGGIQCSVLYNIIISCLSGIVCNRANATVTNNIIVANNSCVKCQSSIRLINNVEYCIIYQNVMIYPHQMIRYVKAVKNGLLYNYITFVDILVRESTTYNIIACNVCLSDFINIYAMKKDRVNEINIQDVLYNVCVSMSYISELYDKHYVMGNKIPYLLTVDNVYYQISECVKQNNIKQIKTYINQNLRKSTNW